MILEKGKLGNTIRKARISNSLTHEELSEIVGITATHLKHIESEHRKPSLDVLFKLASCLHFSLDALLLTDKQSDERNIQKQEIQLLIEDCSSRELNAFIAALRELTKND